MVGKVLTAILFGGSDGFERGYGDCIDLAHMVKGALIRRGEMSGTTFETWSRSSINLLARGMGSKGMEMRDKWET